jgi:hypothetical protein
MLRMNVADGMEDVIATLSGVPAPLKQSLMRWLLSRCLGEDLETWVRTRRKAGKSWDTIAAEMTAALHIPEDVTPIRRQTLQKWFPE